jgi:uncharacterized protein YkwD
MRYLAALCVGACDDRRSFHMARVQQIVSASLAAATLVAVAACLGTAGTAGAGSAPRSSHARGAGSVAVAHSRRGFARRLLRLQNAERRRHGLPGLSPSGKLRRAGRRHARDMVRRHYFGHVSYGGRNVVDRVASTRYGRRTGFTVQENLYWWSRKRSAAAVLSAWMGSATHRANVLHGGFRQFGVGVVMRSPYGRGGVTVVGVYGARSRR